MKESLGMQPTEIERLIVGTWDFDDPAGTEDAFHTLLAGASHASAEAAALLTQVARTHSLRSDFPAADEALDTAVGIIETLDQGTPRDHAEARIAIERGRAINSAGNPADALPYFEAAFELANRAGTEGLVVDALHMQAIAVNQSDSPDDAAGINRRALEVAQRSSDPAARRWRGSLLNNLGWDLHGAGDHAGALGAFEQALAARLEDEGSASQITVARWAVARGMRSVGRLEEALDVQRALAQDPSNADDGYIPEEIAECLLELGRVDEAKVYFAKAHTILSRDPWLVEHEPERLARLAEYTAAESDTPPPH
jgi:tetratricopeptide (TPR) repeat protein